jgi:glycolate oxidase iron-sulfur subunit
MATTTDPSRTALPVVPAAPSRGAAIDYELFLDCVHCGLCTSSCPTYLELGTEMDSPRGRIYLMRAVTDGRLPADDPEVRRHLDLCLDCRACETACPSGVQYGRLIEPFRTHLAKTQPPLRRPSRLERLALFGLTPYARRMRWALAPVRLLQRSGLDRLLERGGLLRLLPRALRRMYDLVPPLAPHHGLPEVLPAEGKRRARVALFLGCAGDAFLPQTNLATARVLQRNGCEVWLPRAQVCCGALHYHAGREEPARAFAAANCAAFADKGAALLAGVDAVVVNAAGCGAQLKDYGHLLHGTPAEAAGRAFAAKVRDVSEFLAALGPVKPEHPLPLKATYHDACHLCHAQQIRRPPRQLLEMIPGLELVPLPESEVCCGAAGSYNVTEPEMAARLGERKARNILATGARAVFTGNAGCLLQIGRHLRRARPGLWVAHPVEALWASYEGKKMEPQRHRDTEKARNHG